MPSLSVAAACLLALPVHANAQAVIGGIVQDEHSKRPVSCLAVALEDSSGTAVDSTWTRRGGRFQFLVMKPGRYRVRFQLKGLVDARSDWEQLAGDIEVGHTFPVSLVADSAFAARLIAGQGNARLLKMKAPPRTQYPVSLRNRRIPGVVVLAIAADSTGRADQESIIPVYASHPEFLKAALAGIARVEFERFTPPNGQDCTVEMQPMIWSVRQ